MEIRKAELRDEAAVMDVIRSCINHMETLGIHQWDEIYPDTATIVSDTEREELFVCEKSGHIAGIIVLNERQEPEYSEVSWQCTGKALVVHRLAVHPSCQGRGYARELMRFAHSYARERSYGTIRLDAFSGNLGALALYENLGYSKAGSVQFRKGRFFCFEIEVRGKG